MLRSAGLLLCAATVGAAWTVSYYVLTSAGRYGFHPVVSAGVTVVTDGEAAADRVLPLQDVNVCPTDRGQRDANDRLARTWPRSFDVFDPDVIRAMEHGRAHFASRVRLGRPI